MRITTLSIIAILIIFLFNSCEKDASLTNIVTNICQKNNSNLYDYDYLTIVPRVGCTGCIGSFNETLIAQPEKFKKHLIIFTGVDDKKRLRNLLKEVKVNYVIDDERLLMAPGIYETAPVEYSITKEGDISIIYKYN